MKKLLVAFIACVLLLGVGGTASAATILFDNWGFDPTGGGPPPAFSPIDEISVLGTAFAQNVGGAPPALGVTFNEVGAYQATSFQNDGAVILPGVSGLGVSYELTGVLNASGTIDAFPAVGASHFTFAPGLTTLDVYLDVGLDFGGSTPAVAPFFGANNGILIASFALVAGDGTFDFNAVGLPDGRVDLLFAGIPQPGLPNGLAPGYWFDPTGVDMSTFPADFITLALVDTNNQLLLSPSATQLSEWQEVGPWGANTAPDNTNFTQFWVRSDGSYKPGVVPEPASMLLLGSGLLGLAGLGRRRFRKKD